MLVTFDGKRVEKGTKMMLVVIGIVLLELCVSWVIGTGIGDYLAGGEFTVSTGVYVALLVLMIGECVYERFTGESCWGVWWENVRWDTSDK